MPIQVRPILRWAGSKRRLLPNLLKRVPSDFRRYYEPFAGSACLFFALDPGEACLGDNNTHLMQMYEYLRLSPAAVWRATLAWDDMPSTYYRVRSMEPSHLAPADRAARFLYLNRHCFNGLYRENRLGRFNVPIGRHTGAIPSAGELEAAAQRLKNAQLIAADFQSSLASVSQGDFVYLDPPFSIRSASRFGEYGYSSFSSADLLRFTQAVQRLDSAGAQVLISYTDSPFLRVSLSGWNWDEIRVPRSIGGHGSRRSSTTEVLISNY